MHYEEQARELARKMDLDEAQTAELVECYPAWAERQPPDSHEEPDEMEEWLHGADISEMSLAERVLHDEWDKLLPGNVLLAPDPGLLKRYADSSEAWVAVPDSSTKVAFKPISELTDDDKKALHVAMLKELHDASRRQTLLSYITRTTGEEGLRRGLNKEERESMTLGEAFGASNRSEGPGGRSGKERREIARERGEAKREDWEAMLDRLSTSRFRDHLRAVGRPALVMFQMVDALPENDRLEIRRHIAETESWEHTGEHRE